MAPIFRAGLVASALVGTTLLAARPVSAAPLAHVAAPSAAATIFLFGREAPGADSAAWGCRWNCGWGPHRSWRRNRIDAGDVLIGAAIIGGVIAIANSNNRRDRERDVVVIERDPRYRDRDQTWDRRDDRRASPRGGGATGLDNAVNICLDRIERDVRVDTVDSVERSASGWQVSGALFNGAPFVCHIGNDGRIDTLDYGAGSAAGAPPRADGQWDESSYAAARAGIGGTVRPDIAVQETAVQRDPREPRSAAAVSAAMPAYPGGPIPGEAIPETIEEADGG